mmetsp:Transcript_39101/g.72879  ORF Transcript_39101/g.72879 Transcript_39101/m.72879 type:complete len:92 (-) Transcript_39101:32-307(-)
MLATAHKGETWLDEDGRPSSSVAVSNKNCLPGLTAVARSTGGVFCPAKTFWLYACRGRGSPALFNGVDCNATKDATELALLRAEMQLCKVS